MIDRVAKLIYTEAMEEKTGQTPSSPSTTAKLPAFGVLFKEAWELSTHVLSSFIKLCLLSFCGFLVVATIIGGGVFLGVMLTPVLGDYAALLIIGALILMVFYLVSVVTLIGVTQITAIKLFMSAIKLPVFKTMKQSAPLVPSFFFTTFLAQFFIFGGLWILFIPGFFIALLFSFVSFVVVTENLNGRAALRRSYQLVRPYVWKILLVSLAVQIPVNILSQLMGRFIEDTPVIYVVYLPFVILSGLYIQALSAVLFKHAKANAVTGKAISMKWILIVGIIGWIIFIVALVTLISAAVSNPSMLDSLTSLEQQGL